MVAGRLFSTIVSHNQQAEDCEYNHQQFEIAHRQHLLLHLSKNREATPPDIRLRIREVEPSTVSRQCHLHYHTCIVTYQEFRLSVFSTLSTDATNATDGTHTTTATDSTGATTATTTTTPTDSLQIQQSSPHSPCLPTHHAHHTHQAHHLYKMLTISKRKSQNSAFWYVQSVMCEKSVKYVQCVMFEMCKSSPQKRGVSS